MIRILGLVSFACLAAGAAVVVFVEGQTTLGIVLLVAWMLISIALAIRRAVRRVRGIVNDARTLISGDIQQARLIEITEPRGFLSPSCTVVLEIEGEDGIPVRIEREAPMPFPMAWSYRFGDRFKIPGLAAWQPGELFAHELRREGLDVDVARGPSGVGGAGGESR